MLSLSLDDGRGEGWGQGEGRWTIKDEVSHASLSVVGMFQFKAPFTACLAAPSGSGKTCWILKFLANLHSLVDGSIEHIVWCYGEDGGLPMEIEKNAKVRTFRGVPEESGLLKANSLLILDDLMSECYSKSTVADLYTKGSRHRKISVFILSQNLFHQSPYSRAISLSTRYFVLLRNVRDRAQFSHLARQIYPENAPSLCSALADAWSRPWSYLLIDLDPRTEEGLRFRTNIFPQDECMIVYTTDTALELLRESLGVSVGSSNDVEGLVRDILDRE